MRAVKNILIANHREFSLPIDQYLNPEELTAWSEEDFDYESTSLFWGGDAKLVITSHPMHPEFVADICQLLDYQAVRVIWPANQGKSLCDEIQNDPQVFQELVETIRISDCPSILVWGASAELYRLIATLQKLGLRFTVPDVPPVENAWTYQEFGSKAGFRNLAQKLSQRYPQINIPPGFICQTLPEALQVAQDFAKRDIPFVVKTNQGSTGWGSIVFKPADLNQPTPDQEEKIRSGIWQSGPVVLEEYIDLHFQASDNPDHFPLIPTIDALITATGEVQFQFTGNMIMENLTHYHGVALGQGVLPAELEARLQEIISIFGTALAENGYRGWFDVDLICDAQQNLYCNEINARRTSPIHAWEIFTRLKAIHPAIQTVLAKDSWEVDDSAGLSYAEVKNRLRDVLFPIAGEPRGLVITVPPLLREGYAEIGFVILGRDFPEVMAIKRQLESSQY